MRVTKKPTAPGKPERYILEDRPRLSDAQLNRICGPGWKRIEHGDDTCTVISRRSPRGLC